MAGPPPSYVVLANGMRDTAQEFQRMAQHPPVTAAILQQQLQHQFQQLQQQMQQQMQQQFQQQQQQLQQQFQQQQQHLQQQFQQQQQQLQQQFAQDLLQQYVLTSRYIHSQFMLKARLYLEQALVSCSEGRQQARVINSWATDATVLVVVNNAAGATPPHWPLQATPARVRRIPGAQLNQILQFYQLPVGGLVADRAQRVLMHLGVRF